jgi:opacity protein-like surface antigen
MLNYKINISISTILFFIFSTMSYPAFAYQLHDGLYLGGQVGFGFARVTQRNNLFDIDNKVNAGYTVAATGVVGGGFIGYGINVIDYFYLGIEALGNASNVRGNNFYNLTPVTDANNKNLISQSVLIKSTWGIDVVPGYKVTDYALLYGRLGIKWASFSSTQDAIIIIKNISTNTNTPHRSTIKPGFNFGLGMELAVANQLSIRGELTHTTYQSYDASSTKTNISYKFHDNQAMVALIYHFA